MVKSRGGACDRLTRVSCGWVVVVLAVAGCSSGRSVRQGASAPTGCSASAPIASRTPPRDAAVALGRRMLDAAVLPPGSGSVRRRPVPTMFGDVVPGPDVGNLVCAYRTWTVARDAGDLLKWFQSHAPQGYAPSGLNKGRVEHGVQSGWVEDDLGALPLNVSAAETLFEVSGDNAGTAIVRVDTVVGWTNPRPTNELASSADRVVTATVLHVTLGSSAPPVQGKQVVITNSDVVESLARVFNGLRILPPQGPIKGYHCGPSTKALAYQVAFSTSITAPADITATLGPCGGGVEVSVRGRSAPELLPGTAFGRAVTDALGIQPS